MRLILKRFCDHREQGVFGELWLDQEFLGFTVEQPWNNNIPSQSCIPAGIYRLEDWNSSRFPDSMVMENANLNVFAHKQDDPFARFACLIHPANWAKDVTGCIGIGKSMGYGEGALMVQSSRGTTAAALKRIREEDIDYLQIRWRLNDATLG